ncbi:MAG: nucleotidyltransferase family protein [Candidatus Aminicenantes bacterium]|nr:nucleotidyltransferase family protein [Candidatus Aminicenantes bacterium]
MSRRSIKYPDFRRKILDSEKKMWMTAGLNILGLEKLSDTIGKMQRKGIPVMLLKGAALLTGIYQNISQRPMEDLDILVRPGDRDKAKEILEEAGYKLVYSNQDNSEVYGNDIPVRMYLDLHWRLVNRNSPSQKYVFSPDEKRIWQRAVPISLGSHTVLEMGMEDLLVYLSFHALKERFLQKKWLRDIQLIVASRKEKINWDRFLNIARKSGADKLCGFIMEGLKLKFSLEVPPSVLCRIKKKYVFFSFERQVFWTFLGIPFLPNSLLWPLAMNRIQKQWRFFVHLLPYLWKKMKGDVLKVY